LIASICINKKFSLGSLMDAIDDSMIEEDIIEEKYGDLRM
jgi:hypothetical protein